MYQFQFTIIYSMIMKYYLLLCGMISITQAIPVVIKESSPSGDAIIAISTNDPEVEKYLRFGFSEGPNINQDVVISHSNEELANEMGIVESVKPQGSVAAADSGRSFMSPSAFNPFLLPFIFKPINFEGIGLRDFGSVNDWVKGVEGFYDQGFPKDGEIKTVSAINDNGHVYGNVKTLTFDNKRSL